MTYTSDVLALSPIWYARLGESSGTTAVDASSGGNNGTINGSPTLGVAGALTGDSNTAMTFASASTQDVRVAFFSGLNITTFTLLAWYKGTGNNQEIFARQGGQSAPYSMVVDTSGKLRCDIKSTANSNPTGSYIDSSSTTINDGNWHMVAVTRDNATSTIAFYVDGVQKSTIGSTLAPYAAGSNGLAVASRGGTPFLNGSVDEPALFNVALTTTQIAALYTSGTTGGASPQTMSPSSIASAAAIGAAAISTAITCSPTGISTAEAFGSTTINAVISLSPTGISSAEVFGSPTINAVVSLSPGAVLSSESFGTPLANVVWNLSAAAIGSGEALGTPSISVGFTMQPAGISTAEVIGAAIINTAITISTTGIVSGETIGAAAISIVISLAPSGISSQEIFGADSVVLGAVTLSPVTINSLEALGNAAVTLGGRTVSPTGIPTGEVISTPTVSSVVSAAPASINSSEAFGNDLILSPISLQALAVMSAEQFGIPTVYDFHIDKPISADGRVSASRTTTGLITSSGSPNQTEARPFMSGRIGVRDV